MRGEEKRAFGKWIYSAKEDNDRVGYATIAPYISSPCTLSASTSSVSRLPLANASSSCFESE